MIGKEVAQEFLCYVLQTAANGLLKGQSVALIRDQVRAELFNHFRSAGQRLLAQAGRHASIIGQLAGGLRAALRQSASSEDALTRNAAKAKQAESRADDIVKETRLTVRRNPGTEVFSRILEVADDAVDDLEDSAFLAGLSFGPGRLSWICQRRSSNSPNSWSMARVPFSAPSGPRNMFIGAESAKTCSSFSKPSIAWSRWSTRPTNANARSPQL